MRSFFAGLRALILLALVLCVSPRAFAVWSDQLFFNSPDVCQRYFGKAADEVFILPGVGSIKTLSFARWIKVHRAEHKLSQKQLSEKIQEKVTVMTAIESGGNMSEEALTRTLRKLELFFRHEPLPGAELAAAPTWQSEAVEFGQRTAQIFMEDYPQGAHVRVRFEPVAEAVQSAELWFVWAEKSAPDAEPVELYRHPVPPQTRGLNLELEPGRSYVFSVVATNFRHLNGAPVLPPPVRPALSVNLPRAGAK